MTAVLLLVTALAHGAAVVVIALLDAGFGEALALFSGLRG